MDKKDKEKLQKLNEAYKEAGLDLCNFFHDMWGKELFTDYLLDGKIAFKQAASEIEALGEQKIPIDEKDYQWFLDWRTYQKLKSIEEDTQREERVPLSDTNCNNIRWAKKYLVAAYDLLTDMNGKDMDNLRKAAKEICIEKIQDALQRVSSFALTEAISDITNTQQT